MSEFDNLEELSNADLRALCIQHGLPNVPITQSSRQLLIKKLRAIAEPAKAKSNRRETIAAVEKVAPVAVAKAAEEETATRRANRRTIAATSTQPDVAAPVATPNKVFEVKITEKVGAAAATAPAPAPAPVATRRRSVQRETAAPPPKPVAMQTIILDDDEEEDEDVDSLLAIAADTAERQNYAAKRESPLKANRSRSSSFSQSEVVTTSLSSNMRVMPPLLEQSDSAFSEPFEPKARSSTIYQASTASALHERNVPTTAKTYAAVPLVKPTPLAAGSFGEAALTSRQIHTSATLAREPYASSHRYSSVLGTGAAANEFASPSARYSVPASRPLAAVASPAFATKYQYKEFSDEYDSGDQDDDAFKTPYLSKFARNLEQLKGQPLSPAVAGASSEVGQRRAAAQRHTVYETPAHRRPIGQQANKDDAVSVAFWKLWADLDRKYNVKLIFKFIVALVVIIFVYVMVTPD